MLSSSQRYSGTNYTTTCTLLVLALIVVPVVLFASSPNGQIAVSTAAVVTALCLGFAWRSWRRTSELSVPTITGVQGRRS